MRNTKTLVVLSVVALLLAGGVLALALINPLILIGLAPVLLAIAAIVRAIAGSPTGPATRSSVTDVGPTDEDTEPSSGDSATQT